MLPVSPSTWTLVPRCVLLISGLVLAGGGAEGSEAAGLGGVRMGESHRTVLLNHCERCHGAEKQKGSFRVDTLPLELDQLAAAEAWQKVLNALNSGEMPPEEAKQLPVDTKTEFLDELSQAMVRARRLLADQKGHSTMRRLNRREYRNTLQALLGVRVEVGELPADTGGKHFDTVGAGLFLTGNQFEQYEAIGRDALEEAFRAYQTSGQERKTRFEGERIHPVFLKRNQEGISNIERAKTWIRAVDEAAALPQNTDTVAALRKIAPTDEALRYHWKKIPGAPSPVEHGFDPTTEINPAIIYRYLNNSEFIGYDAQYLRMPHLDKGMYLALGTGYGGTGHASILALALPQDFPPGEYTVRIRAGTVREAPAERCFFEFGLKGYAGALTPALSSHQVSAPIEAAQIVEIPFTFSARNAEKGFRQIFIREKGSLNTGLNVERIREAQERNGSGPGVALWIDWVEVELNRRAPGDLPPGIRALGACLGSDPGTQGSSEARECSREALSAALANFAREAYRGVDAPEGTVSRLLKIYDSNRGNGAKHLEALRDTLACVLSSPRFLYRAEPDAEEIRRDLDSFELASRLSYFLWGAPPDGELLQLAEAGRLREPGVLASQTDRLLAHANAGDSIRSFLTQWLLLDRLDLFQFSQKLFPDFDDATKAVCRQEVYETFAHLLRENRSLGDLLKADYVVVNGLLARYYQLPNVVGDAFRAVPLPAGSPRGGLLGMAAILAMGSNGERTNPVERGAWVLRKLLHDPPPPAPANVPEIARLAGRLLTTRERLQAHQEDPQCASCHRKIDPIGFGLENFDAVGRWRTDDSYQILDSEGKPAVNGRKTWTIDPASTFHKGPAFADFFEMRDGIALRLDAFSRSLSAALIEYGLGRPCGFTEEALVEEMLRHARGSQFTPRAFIHALVQSSEFQKR